MKLDKKIVKLWRAMLQLSEIATDKATLIVEDTLAEGVEVFVEDENGEYVPAEDGEYVAEDKVIVVAEGKVSEIREKEDVEETTAPTKDEEENTVQETAGVELTAKDKFNTVKEKFEASYQEIEQNIYSALQDAGIWGYVLENSNDYAVVSIWDEEDSREHLFRYDISIDENGFVTLGERKEVRVEYVPVDEPEADEVTSEELAAKDARIAELEQKLAEQKEQLEMSADKPAKEKVKESPKVGALRYFN
jgi:hypothetical protein